MKALPEYEEPWEVTAHPEAYPLILVAGGRLPGAFHSRYHRVRWARALREHAAIDIHPKTAENLKIGQDDFVTVETQHGTMRAYANLTNIVPEQSIFMYQGYSEADVNTVIGLNHLDPYSGFPGYRSVRCAVRRDA